VFKKITFFTKRNLPKKFPASDLPAGARARLKGQDIRATAVPSGYALQGGDRDANNPDYKYNSDSVLATEASCEYILDLPVDCTTIQQVSVQIHENLTGGGSSRWYIILNALRTSGPAGYIMSYDYECGVNITLAADQTCSTWADDGADGPDTDVPSFDGDSVNRDFGFTKSVTKYPMINVHIEFADGSVAVGDDGTDGEKFRGWDVCVDPSGNAKLCPLSDPGSS